MMELDFAGLRLSGREKEVEKLRGCYQRTICMGSIQVCMIEGASGSGKTAIVECFQESLNDTLFCKGKFDQDSMTPFSAISESLRSLLEQVVTDEEAKKSIQDIPRSEIRTLAAVLPQIKTLFPDGEEDSANMDESDGFRSQWGLDRLRVAIRSLIRTICSYRLVVLFLDDLHWIDEGSLKILNTLVLDKEARNLLFVCTHRIVPDNHCILGFKADIANANLTSIQVGNLNLDAVQDLISNLLRQDEEEVEPLSNVVHRKTDGNAFFVIQFLRLLAEQGFIFYSMNDYRWKWDLNRIAAETDISDNVLDIVSAKIQAMPSKLQVTLMSAACLGATSFDIKMLFRILLKNEDIMVGLPSDWRLDSSQELHQALDLAVKEGLLDKLSGSGMYKFAHDRIRGSAYVLLPQGEERARFHLHFGRCLLGILSEGGEEMPEAERLLLLSVHHLNRGSALMNDHDECMELANLNLKAANLAFAKSAFREASDYLRAGLALLGVSRWTDHYELTNKMTTALAHVCFCYGCLDETWVAIQEVLDNAQSFRHKLGGYRSMVLALTQEGKAKEAIGILIFVLNKLGVPVPKRFLKLHAVIGFLRLKRKLHHLSDEELLVRGTTCREQRQIEVADFIVSLAEIGLTSGINDYMFISMLHYTHYTFSHGHSRGGSLFLACCAQFYAFFGNFESAYRYGRLALQLAEEGKYPIEDSRAITQIHYFVSHWKKPYNESLEPSLAAIRMFMDTGIVENLYYSVVSYVHAYYNCGLRLDFVNQDAIRFMELLSDYSQGHYIELLNPFVHLIRSLIGDTENPVLLMGEALDQNLCVKQTKSARALQLMFLFQMFLAYYFDDLQLALEMSNRLCPPKKQGPTPFLCPRFLFQGLIEFAMAKLTGSRRSLRRGKKFLRKLESFLEGGNPNCHHMVLLLQAECKSFCEDEHSVQNSYDEAIKSAAKSGYTHNQALANELAGKYFLERFDNDWASTYLSRACDHYSQWGALAKVKYLKSKYCNSLDLTQSERDVRGLGLRARSRLDNMSTEIKTVISLPRTQTGVPT